VGQAKDETRIEQEARRGAAGADAGCGQDVCKSYPPPTQDA